MVRMSHMKGTLSLGPSVGFDAIAAFNRLEAVANQFAYASSERDITNALASLANIAEDILASGKEAGFIET